ncbi:MAG TPA: hypothetical protein V6D29_22695 [Leptolyngbyaceae cyanobacterium]
MLLTSLATASAVLLSLTPNTALPNTAAQQSSNQTPVAEPTQPATEQREPAVAQGTPQCLPNQFLSPFSDVYPTDWAYEAVSQIASAPLQCFDLPLNLQRNRPSQQ